MNAIYLSGTGNTKHITELLFKEIGAKGTVVPIESPDVNEALKDEELIIAYPTQFSNIPYLVRDFINKHAADWNGKKIFLITTMGLFAGDGTGCAARLLKKYGAEITGGLQIVMPDSIGDCKALKKPHEKNKEIIAKADKRIVEAAGQIKAGNNPSEGLSFWAHLAGLFGQRLWFYNKTSGYSKAGRHQHQVNAPCATDAWTIVRNRQLLCWVRRCMSSLLMRKMPNNR